MPDISADIERAGTIASRFASFASEAVGEMPIQRLCLCLRRREVVFGYSHGVECVLLQCPNASTEETSADKKEEVGDHDEEYGKSGARGKGVDQVTASYTTDDAYDSSERNRCGRFTNGDTTNKNDSFKTCIVYQRSEVTFNFDSMRTYLHAAR